MLVLRVGNDLGRLDMELGKLAASACGGGEGVHEITPAIVAVMVGMSREEEAWGVQGSLLSGNTEGTIAHLRQVLEVSRQPAQLVMWSVTDLARKLHAVCCGQHQGRNIESMAGPLKLWGPGKFAIDNAARRLKPRQTMEFFRACVKADQRSKSGFTEPDRALEVLTVRLHRAMGAR